MMIDREATVMEIQAQKMRFDALALLGKIGFKTLTMKLLAGGLICTGMTIALSYLAAYGTLRREIGALAQSQQIIGQFAGLALLLNLAIFAFAGMVIFLLSKNISEALAPALVEGSRDGAVAASIFSSQEDSRQELEESRRTNARLTAILDSLPQSVFCKDLTGAYVFSNKAFCARLGLSPELIIGNSDSIFLAPDSAAQRAVEDRQIVESGQPLESILNELGSDSKEVFLQLIRTPTFGDDGEIIGVQGIFFDVTKSKLAEAALEQERTLLRALMDNTPDFVYFKDKTSRFLRINKAHATWFGLKDPSQAIGKADFDFFTGEHAQQAYEDEQRIISSGQPLVGVEEKETWPDREDTWVSTTKSPLYDLDQRIIGTFGITRDITERKRAEQTLERSLSEFLAFVSQVSRGDLTRRNKEGEDTLGLVAQSINRMLDNFSAMLTQVKQLGLSISSSTTQILVAAEQIEEGTQRQTDETTNVTSSVEEMAASMALVSQHAAGSVEAARRALVAAEQGSSSVRDTSLAMSRIASAVDRAADRMRLLVKRSSEISEIINLISDVAAQTNLLSLNAAIQAAHAGEAGLGFSVVAEEIRKLAERSAHSTKDVSYLIKTIQAETAEALDAMENGLTEVKNGGSVAEKSKQALQDISVVVTQSAALIEEISAASDEQARVTHRLASAMQEISSVTIEASAGARETSAIIQGLARLSERLNESISQFKIVSPEGDGRSA